MMLPLVEGKKGLVQLLADLRYMHYFFIYLIMYLSIYVLIHIHISTNLFIYLSFNLTTYLYVHADDRYSGTLTWPSYIVVHDDSVDADLTDQVHKALARSLIL